ncbi:MAG: CoA transferase [Deltaproteobacteria bacterium]|nr:CoA transferase [Deltaproteobacteria bacterium]
MLESVKALDLTDFQGFFCGRILADMGVDVIKIEKPGGDPSRDIGPFHKGKIDSERSLFWFAYNANKRGITLDIEREEGREIFKKLVKAADFIIESYPVDYMRTIGLDYSELCKINPKIIVVSITPFGSKGPYSSYRSCELVNMAMSGLMNLSGDPDRPPIMISYPHACHHAGAQAAVAALAAYYWRHESDRGQHIDIAVRDSIIQMIAQPIAHWCTNNVKVRRSGQHRIGWGPGLVRQIWPCRDGFVIFLLGGGGTRARTNKSLTGWMDSEGMASDFMKKMDWDVFDMSTTTETVVKELEKDIGRFLMAHTKEELFEGGMRRHVDIYPVNDCRDIAEEVQLKERNFWIKVDHPELGEELIYPGTFVRSSETFSGIRQRAPLTGEHSRDIYERELGISKTELDKLRQRKII